MVTSLSILGGLFLATFLAATILPLSSEGALSAALLSGLHPLLCLTVALLGNASGSLSTFYLGRLGRFELLEKYCRMKRERILQIREKVERYGGIAAFLCFLPLVGDLFAVALGFMRYPPGRFTLLMTSGKLIRYLFWMALHYALFSE